MVLSLAKPTINVDISENETSYIIYKTTNPIVDLP